MTLERLYQHVDVTWKGYGSYQVLIKYRNKFYRCIAHDSMMWDTIKGAHTGYTIRQAFQHFYDECKRQNNLK